MTPVNLISLLLLFAPFVALVALWVWWLRRLPQKHRDESAKRNALLELSAETPVSLYFGRSGLEYLVLVQGVGLALFTAGMTLPVSLAFGHVPSGLELLGVGLFALWAGCAGLWKYARSKNRQAALYFSKEGLQALTSMRLLWRDVEKVEAQEVSYGAGAYTVARNTLTLTMRRGVEVQVHGQGGLLLRKMLYLGRLHDGRVTVTVDATNLEDWVTVDALSKVIRKRIEQQ